MSTVGEHGNEYKKLFRNKEPELADFFLQPTASKYALPHEYTDVPHLRNHVLYCLPDKNQPFNSFIFCRRNRNYRNPGLHKLHGKVKVTNFFHFDFLRFIKPQSQFITSQLNLHRITHRCNLLKRNLCFGFNSSIVILSSPHFHRPRICSVPFSIIICTCSSTKA